MSCVYQLCRLAHMLFRGGGDEWVPYTHDLGVGYGF